MRMIGLLINKDRARFPLQLDSISTETNTGQGDTAPLLHRLGARAPASGLDRLVCPHGHDPWSPPERSSPRQPLAHVQEAPSSLSMNVFMNPLGIFSYEALRHQVQMPEM